MGRDQVPGDPAHEHGVGHPVGDRVEEGAPDRRGAGRLGHRAVEQVVEPGQGEQGDRRDEVPGGRRRPPCRRRTRGPVAVSTSAVTPCATRRRPTGPVLPVDRLPPATIEHAAPLRHGLPRATTVPPPEYRLGPALGPAPAALAQRALDALSDGRRRDRQLGSGRTASGPRPHGLPGRSGQWPNLSPSPSATSCLVGHHGAGKTTLAEALLAVTGAIARLGSVEQGHHGLRLRARGDLPPALGVAGHRPPSARRGEGQPARRPGLRRLRRRARRRPRPWPTWPSSW